MSKIVKLTPNQPATMSVGAAIAGLDSTIRAMEADYRSDPKGAQKERNINQRATSLRDTLNGLVQRLHPFISHS